jgi:hypothetical protein
VTTGPGRLLWGLRSRSVASIPYAITIYPVLTLVRLAVLEEKRIGDWPTSTGQIRSAYPHIQS